jgi:hypothetical protein
VCSVTRACERGGARSPPRVQAATSRNGAANLVLRPGTTVTLQVTRSGERVIELAVVAAHETSLHVRCT